MNPPNPNLYARGTANWNRVAASQGENAANAQWQAAITAYANQTPLDTSTWDAFGTQILTDPLGAPLADLNTGIGNTIIAFLKNPWVVALVVSGLFFFLGGADFLRRKLKGGN